MVLNRVFFKLSVTKIIDKMFEFKLNYVSISVETWNYVFSFENVETADFYS